MMEPKVPVGENGGGWVPDNEKPGQHFNMLLLEAIERWLGLE